MVISRWSRLDSRILFASSLHFAVIIFRMPCMRAVGLEGTVPGSGESCITRISPAMVSRVGPEQELFFLQSCSSVRANRHEGRPRGPPCAVDGCKMASAGESVVCNDCVALRI